MAPSNSVILLDTHILIWTLEQTEKIGQASSKIISSADTVIVSQASLWELAIKYRQGKFPYDTRYLLKGISDSGFSLLNITVDHIQQYPRVKLTHKDPFDTMLVAQAATEKCVLLTADKSILKLSLPFVSSVRQ